MEAAFNYLNFNYEDLRSPLQDLQEGHEPSKVSFDLSMANLCFTKTDVLIG